MHVCHDNSGYSLSILSYDGAASADDLDHSIPTDTVLRIVSMYGTNR
jgi:hypothetical protein